MIIKLKWSKAISVGIDVIDQQHQKLFSIVNDLIKVHQQKDNQKEILKVLFAIVKYAEDHFVTEDEYMTVYEYPKYLDHRKEHTEYLSHINLFLKGYEEGSKTLTMEMLRFLSKWWLEHTSDSDMDFGIWVKSRDVRKGVN